jgi:chemotaxis family two-component system sensor kinase Cph1
LEGITAVSSGLDQSNLRDRAKKRLDGKGPIQVRSAEDNVKLVEELSLHQEELNIQNEELLRIQEELEVSKAKYFELYDLAPVGYITLSPGLMIKEANLSTSTILGSERNDLIGRALSTFVLPQSQESLYLHYRRLGHEKRKQVGTFLVRGMDGRELQIQFESNRIGQGPIKGFRSILTDVSERRKIEDELERTKARLEAIINQMPVGIMVADAQSGEILFANDEIDKMYRLGFNPINIKGFADYHKLARRHLDGRPYKTEEYPLFRSVNGSVIRNELALVLRPDGSEVFINSSSVPVRNSHGVIVASVALSVDVTEAIQTQRERDKLHSDLETYSRKLQISNAELKQFAYVASHDLKEPLRMIVSYLSLLERKYGDKLDPEAHEYIHFASDGGERLNALIDDLLEYSRLDWQSKPSITVDMNEAVTKSLIILKVQVEDNDSNIVIDPLPTVLGDESQIVLLMQNLLSNAIKFRGQDHPQIHISATIGPGEWIIRVLDNGIGLSMADSERIFQMFQRLHSRDEFPGTGIGLAIAKKIVERHGGRIWVESEEGKGATFLFSIPKSGGDGID